MPAATFAMRPSTESSLILPIAENNPRWASLWGQAALDVQAGGDIPDQLRDPPAAVVGAMIGSKRTRDDIALLVFRRREGEVSAGS